MGPFPRIIAHRGSPRAAPENTLASFRQAATEGASFVEFDAALTADNRVVVFHDDDLDRTSDGHGPLAETLFEATQALDAGSWFAPAFKGELIPLDDEGVLICNSCSTNVQYLIENEKPSYKEPPKEVCFYAYKKINHFKEILAQFQGKETTQIPVEVIENLKQQIKKERIELSSMTYYKTKDLLKKLGYNKYYEHINFIKNKLGIKPPIISQELEETLCNFFMEIQYPYAKHCPDYRVNFLHYYYVLYKLFELLGESHYLIEIPMLKDREKLIEQDIIWKKICEELDWEFIATI